MLATGATAPLARRSQEVINANDVQRYVERRYGITGWGAKIFAAIATGTSLIDYADAAGINVGTARWCLEQALAKTGVQRTSELVRQVLDEMAKNTAMI